MVGARGLCSLSGRKIDSESAWGILNLHIGCWVSGRMLCWSLIVTLSPEQGWQCERQMVPLGVSDFPWQLPTHEQADWALPERPGLWELPAWKEGRGLWKTLQSGGQGAK